MLGLERPIRPASPLGSISQSLESIDSPAHRAEEIEKKLVEGQTIIELATSMVDSSFVVDRLGVDAEDTASLVAQIKDTGSRCRSWCARIPTTKAAIKLPTAIVVWRPRRNSGGR